MTLRRRLFLLLGGLICLLLVGQWLLFRSLAQAVSADVRTVAFQVGEEILSGFSYRTESAAAADGGEGEGRADSAAQLVVVTSETPDPEPDDDPPGAAPNRVTVTRKVHFKGPGIDPVVAGAERSRAGQRDPARGSPPPPGSMLRKIVLETDAARDVLFVQGPAMTRTIPIPRAAISTTLDRFGSRLVLGNLALLALGLLGAAVVAHRLTRPLASLADAAERLGAGELGAAVAVERDDEIGRAVASFNRMSHQLADLDRENRRLAAVEQLSELGEVARGLAHSLRNPLNALGLAIEQLGDLAGSAVLGDGRARGTTPADVVEGSRRQIRRMDSALRSFLALASAGSAQAERVDLAQLAREVALEALQDGAGRVRIEVEVAPGAPGGSELAVEGVPAELKAALQALVVNAVEASPDGGRVTIRLDRAENGKRIAIDDEGPGLPETVRARLFEPHVTTKPHGSGMGLFLAHRLITGRYAGVLRLDPLPGGRAPAAGDGAGTRATIELGDRAGERSRARQAGR